MIRIERLLQLERYLLFVATLLTFAIVWVTARRALQKKDTRAWDILGLGILYFGVQSYFGTHLYALIFSKNIGALLFLFAPHFYLRLTRHFVHRSNVTEHISLAVGLGVVTVQGVLYRGANRRTV